MALNDLAILTAEEGDLAGARPLLEDALTQNRALGQNERAAKNLSNLGELCWYLGERDAAKTYREQARELLTQQGDTRGLVVLLNNLGNAEREAGNPSTARAYLTESLRLARGLGDKKNVFTVLESLADLSLDAGDANQAARLLAASEAQHVLAGVPVPAALHESHSRRRDAVRARFAPSVDFDVAWASGSALSLDQAITLALGENGDAVSGG